MDEERFNFLKDVYLHELDKEEERGNSFGQKASNLVGFLGATVGIFIGTLLTELIEKKFVDEVFASCKTTIIFWLLSLISFGLGILIFAVMIFLWKKMLSPVPYMHPAPSSFLSNEDYEKIKTEYIEDLDKSLRHNQDKINNLGTQFINITSTVKYIIFSFIAATVFFMICKLSV